MIASYDGRRWSDPIELTPPGEYDNATRANPQVYQGTLYVGWGMPEPTEGTSSGEHWDVMIRNIEVMPLSLSLDLGKDGDREWSMDQMIGGRQVALDPAEVQALLEDTDGEDDGWGNEMVRMGLEFRTRFPSHINISNLIVVYDYTARVESIEAVINDALKQAGGYGKGTGNVSIDLAIGAKSSGKIIVKNLKIKYLLNFAPELTEGIPDVTFPEDTVLYDALDLENYFWDDWDDGHLSFRIVDPGDDSHLLTMRRDGNLSFRPVVENWYGTTRIQVSAIDGFGLETLSNYFNVTVEPVNDPPELGFIKDRSVMAGEKISVNCTATDPENDPLTFSDDSDLFDIDPATGRIRWSPDREGIHEINITVSDGNGGFDHQSFTIRVQSISTSSMQITFSLLFLVLAAMMVVIVAFILKRRVDRYTHVEKLERLDDDGADRERVDPGWEAERMKDEARARGTGQTRARRRKKAS
jgi:hypothetical protein